MDDPPPPVPPKDTPVKPSMDADRATPAPPSSSKRKREVASDEHVYTQGSSHLEAPDFTGHSPKRSRPSLQPSDNDASDDATPVQRNVRRKKGVNNLSNLNLRHAAERQARQLAESQPVPRESKFQEGSLTDKPSARPPTAFTRFTRTDSGNIHLVDELMNDYHNGMPSPHRSVEIDNEQQKAQQIAQPTSAIQPQPESTDENNSFFFRFGRSLAASFHPVRMWKQVWEETTEELRQKNLAELERKRALKEEAERRYAQMKASGQLQPRVVSRASVAESDVTIRDSGVILASGTPTFGHRRDASDGSTLVPPTIDVSTASDSDARDAAPKVAKTFRSRLSFKRPSLQNLRFDLKRTKSEFNIGAAANAHRESSSSVSPVKAEIGDSALKKSHSKIDMRKQYKLSKRVSNLETKLQLARRELDEALVQASPMPKLGNKYERFTPNSTLTRSTFIPGRLETLPSERLLDPSQYDLESEASEQVIDQRAKAADAETASTEPVQGGDLMDLGEEDDEETIRMSRAQPYPPRASSLFNLRNKNIEDAARNTAHNTEPAQNDTDNGSMNFNDESEGVNETRKGPKKAASYATLDAKLKALDANVNMANRRPPVRRKRKSGDDQKDYRPEDDDEDDDDDEWGRIGGKTKRRKSAGTTKKKATRKSGTFTDESATQANEPEAENNDAEVTKSPDGAAVHTSARKSLDSQHAAALEPVAEEEGDEAAFANRDPVKKPADSPQQGSDEELMTRAAAAARKHRSHSPSGLEKASLQHADGSSEPATSRSAKSAKSARGRPKKGKVDESFEWPEDVF